MTNHSTARVRKGPANAPSVSSAEPSQAQHALRGGWRGEPKSPRSPLTSSGVAARPTATDRPETSAISSRLYAQCILLAEKCAPRNYPIKYFTAFCSTSSLYKSTSVGKSPRSEPEGTRDLCDESKKPYEPVQLFFSCYQCCPLCHTCATLR